MIGRLDGGGFQYWRRGFPVEPVYPLPAVSVGPFSNLRKDVAARVGETGRHMLLVCCVEGCFREAVEALERSFWERVVGMLCESVSGSAMRKVGKGMLMARTVDDVA
jgi:hypothetical protein